MYRSVLYGNGEVGSDGLYALISCLIALHANLKMRAKKERPKGRSFIHCVRKNYGSTLRVMVVKLFINSAFITFPFLYA